MKNRTKGTKFGLNLLLALTLVFSSFSLTNVYAEEETPATPETPVEETVVPVEETVEETEETIEEVTEEPTEEAEQTPVETEEPVAEETTTPAAEATPVATVEAEESATPSVTPEESVTPTPSASAEAVTALRFERISFEEAYQWSAVEEATPVDLIAELEIKAFDKDDNEVEVYVKDNGGLDLTTPGTYTITIGAINPENNEEETTTFELTINGEELAMPLSGTYEVQPGDTAAILRSKVQSGVDTIHFGPGTWVFTDMLSINPADAPNGVTFINDGTVNFNTSGAAMSINVGSVPVNFQGGTWNITTDGRGMNLWAQDNGSFNFSNMTLNINTPADNMCINAAWYTYTPINFTNVNLTGVITSSGNEGNIQTDSAGPMTITNSTISLNSRNSGMFGPIYHAGDMIVTGSTMNLDVANNNGIVIIHGKQLNIGGGSTVTVTGNGTGGTGINATGPVIIDGGANVNVSNCEQGFGIYNSFNIDGANVNLNGNTNVFVSKAAGTQVKVTGNSNVLGATGTTNYIDPSKPGATQARIIVDSGNVDIPAATEVYNSLGDRLTRFDIPYTTTGSVLNLGYSYACPSTGSNAIWALAVNVKFYDQQYTTYGTTGLLATVPVIKNTSVSFSNRVSSVPTSPSGAWAQEPSGATWTTSVNAPTDLNVYASVATPTPTPVVTPTPTPTTNPGRTCQDDGYPAGYYWNGTACVIDTTPTPVIPTPTPRPIVIVTPTPTPTASAQASVEPTTSPTPTFTAEVQVGGTTNSNSPDAEQPSYGTTDGNWALVNLLCALGSLLLGVILLAQKKSKEEDAEDENGNPILMSNGQVETVEYERNGALKIVTTIIAIVSVIAFVLTENISLPMVMTDKWTILMAVLLLASVVAYIFGIKWKEQENKQEN